tara:strand:- start:72 stop:485 length:414 start_codon:yes stop_codon:yes gene_type:complete
MSLLNLNSPFRKNENNRVSDEELLNQLDSPTENEYDIRMQKLINEGETRPIAQLLIEEDMYDPKTGKMKVMGGGGAPTGGLYKSIVKGAEFLFNVRQGGLGGSSGYIPAGYEYVQDPTYTYNTYLNPPKLKKLDEDK